MARQASACLSAQVFSFMKLGCSTLGTFQVHSLPLPVLKARSRVEIGLNPKRLTGLVKSELRFSVTQDLCGNQTAPSLSSWRRRHHLSAEAAHATGGTSELADATADGAAKKPKRFAVLMTGHASPYSTEKYGGYGPMFINFLREPGEEWEVFEVIAGQFPPKEEVPKFDGFVLTGSRHDAHSDEPWILELVTLLQEIHARKQRILGICFGHQVLSRALGGETGRAPEHVGWEIGMRELELTESFRQKPYARGLPAKLRVLQSHRDQVSKLPPSAELLGSSPGTKVEVYEIEGIALCLQGHPEFTRDVLEDLIEGRRVGGWLTDEQAAHARQTLTLGEPDNHFSRELCRAFLKEDAPRFPLL